MSDESKTIQEATGSPVSRPDAPEYLSAFDSEWTWYVLDSGDLAQSFRPIGDPDEFEYERVWMMPIRASQAGDYGFSDDECDDTVLRDRATGRFVPRWLWIETRDEAPGSVAYYAARALTPATPSPPASASSVASVRVPMTESAET